MLPALPSALCHPALMADVVGIRSVSVLTVQNTQPQAVVEGGENLTQNGNVLSYLGAGTETWAGALVKVQ